MNNKGSRIKEIRTWEQDNGGVYTRVQKSSKGSGYEKWPLIEEFKRGINKVIRRKLIKVERSPRSIDQQYKYTTNLDKHWRESQREKERLREKKEGESQRQRQQTKVVS